RGLRDRQGFVHFARELTGQAGAFVANEDGERQSPGNLGQRSSLMGRSCEQANAARAQKRDQFRGRDPQPRQAEDRARRTAQNFRVVRTDRSFGQKNSGGAKGFGGAQNR